MGWWKEGREGVMGVQEGREGVMGWWQEGRKGVVGSGRRVGKE